MPLYDRRREVKLLVIVEWERDGLSRHVMMLAWCVLTLVLQSRPFRSAIFLLHKYK